MDLEEVGAQLLLGQPRGDRDQVAGGGDAVLGGQRRAVLQQAAYIGLLLVAAPR